MLIDKTPSSETNDTENKLVISPYGSDVALGIQGDANFREFVHNLFVNFGATSGKLHELAENFVYFLSTEDKLFDALAAYAHLKMITDGTSKNFKKNPEGMKQATSLQALDEMESWTWENFMNQFRASFAPIFHETEGDSGEIPEAIENY